MDSMIMWGGYVLAAIAAGVAVVVGKKNNTKEQDSQLTEELSTTISSLEKDVIKSQSTVSRLEQELKEAQQERDEKSAALTTLEEDFESKMDDVVQSSIQKITHADQAKEEAMQAAEDNYEAAAEAIGKVREQEKEIAALKQQLG